MRRFRPRHLVAVLQEHRTLGAEREADETRPLAQGVELEPVHDRQLRFRRALAGGRRVEEEARSELARPRDGLGRDLLLAEDRVGGGEREVLGPQLCVRARRDDDRRLPRGIDRDQRDSGRSLPR